MARDYEQDIERHYWWNLAMIAGVEGCWGFGVAFVSEIAVLPVLLNRMGASDFVVGLLPALFMLCLNTPQLLAARVTRHMPVKKVFFTLTHYPGTLPLIALGYLTWRYGEAAPGAVMAATFGWIVLFGLSISFAMPMWVNLMAKLFPPSVRGRSVGYVSLLGSILGALGSWCVVFVLAQYAFPHNFAILFVVAGVVLSGCVTSFFWLREPASPAVERETTRHFLRDLAGMLRTAPGFMWFMLARFVGTFGVMAGPFYTLAGLAKFDLPVEVAGKFGATLLVARVAGSVVGGWLGDRFGFKILVVAASVCGAAAAGVAIWAPTPGWYYVVFVLVGLYHAMGMIGSFNLQIEFCPTEDKTTFIAFGSTVVCPALVLGPLVGGLLAEHHSAHYNAVFVGAMVCSLLGLVVTLLFVQEPRSAKLAE